jgi:hypothetical protein
MVIAFKETQLWYDNFQTLHMSHKPIPIIWTFIENPPFSN